MKKLNEIAKEHNWDQTEFLNVIKTTTIDRKQSLTSGIMIDDSDVEKAVEAYRKYLRDNQMTEDELRERAAAKASMLITSGYGFEGFRIIKYSAFISGDDAAEIPRSTFLEKTDGNTLTEALSQVRINALDHLKDAAYELGCNAIIGVDYDYLTLEPETASINRKTLYEPYIICVTANGNAVIIEKS